MPLWAQVALIALFALGVFRAAAVLGHDPLLAYANSFDEVRYTACFGLYPDRARQIPPIENSPWAPYSRYAFIEGQEPMCYWSTELAPLGLAALGYRAAEALGAENSHSVRWPAALKLALLLGLSIAVTAAWLRRGNWRVALVNAALLPLVLCDPANTLYLGTFYAEWVTLCAWYALVASALLAHGRAATPGMAAALSLAALALGLGKLQHMVLPLALGAVLVLHERLRAARWSWQGGAVLAGALLGLAAQVVQLGRDDPILKSVRDANAVDVVLIGLLPASSDPARTLERIGLPQSCLRWSGKHAWELPAFDYEAACPGITRFGRGRELALLLREPGTALALLRNGLGELDAWLTNLGTVEDADDLRLPEEFASIGRPMAEHAGLRALLLTLPILAACLLLARLRKYPEAALATGLVAATMVCTYVVVVLGDGLADAAKQSHLVFDAALAWNASAAAVALRYVLSRGRSLLARESLRRQAKALYESA